MKTRLLTVAIFAAMAIMMVGAAQATPTLSIQLADSNGNNITNLTVPVNTVATISAYYFDSGGSDAQATLTVFYDNGLGPQLVATLYSGTVKSGATVTESYTLIGLGTYEFRWTCTPDSVTTSSFSTSCPPAYQQRCQVITHIPNTVPEPIPVAGVTIGLLAFGLFSFKRKRAKLA